MLFEVLGELLPDAIYTTEVGLHQLDAAEWLDIDKPRHFISSGGLGAMGFGTDRPDCAFQAIDEFYAEAPQK